MIMKLWALWALVGTASALLPVIVPISDNANDTQLTWGPVTADISANRCRAFALDLEEPHLFESRGNFHVFRINLRDPRDVSERTEMSRTQGRRRQRNFKPDFFPSVFTGR